jgi:ribosomal protein S18 acetylase RimI-like enzyme
MELHKSVMKPTGRAARPFVEDGSEGGTHGIAGSGDRFQVRLIAIDHPDRTLALQRCLGLRRPGSSSAPADPATSLLASVERQGPSIDLLFGAYRDDELLGACLALESPGRAAMVFAACDTADPLAFEATAAALRALQEAARERSVALLEVLIDSKARALARVLAEAGFRYLTRLLYLTRSAKSKAVAKGGAHDLRWQSFGPQHTALFCEALEGTYVGSLDCPELTGLRPTADVLAGHQAGGLDDPPLWWVATRVGVPVGVLLLNRLPLGQAVELVYVGVAHAARGTGVGDALLARAVASATDLNDSTLTLGVDCRNSPALRLYGRWGFERTGSRDAWIASPGHT